MLGSVAETEDALQDVWLAWSARHRIPDAEPVHNARAYLVRIAANRALARRADMSRRRETYIGSWLPEPLVTAESEVTEGAERAEALSMAVLVVLETLSPLERAVFVLHEVFGFAHPEIARVLDRSPAAVRQIATRARRHVHTRRPRHQPEPALHAQVSPRPRSAATSAPFWTGPTAAAADPRSACVPSTAATRSPRYSWRSHGRCPRRDWTSTTGGWLKTLVRSSSPAAARSPS